jgi:N-acetylmuramate 1-kinase
MLTLSGDLGAGKTFFARALIRHLAGDETVEVPSPTFTLMQAYELPRFPLVHADFYRVSGSRELAELGFDDLPEGAVVVLEWPERAEGLLPPDRIDVALTLVPKLKSEFRHARVTGYGGCGPRVDRIAAVRQFMAESGLSEATRTRMPGDASTRSYHRLALGKRRALLMNWPQRPDGPPVRDGKPYSQIAHLAESVTPFVAVAKAPWPRRCASRTCPRPRSTMPTSTRACSSSRTWARKASSPAVHRRRPRNAMRRRSTSSCTCMENRCPTYCRWRRISITASPSTTSTR